MSSEAITRNDLKAVLDEVLPPTPSEYKKLLWTNPSPTSAFNAQTIPLDLSNYDAIEIIIRADTANTYTIAPIITEVGKGGIAFNSTAYNSVRQFTTTTSGITFTGATYHSAYGNWSTTSTNALIPVKIYGIKYERVAPPQVEYPNYSTEEQQVGTWIDGKPIYRKVIVASITSSGANFITAPSNIDTIIGLRGIEKETGGAQAPFPKAHYSSFAYQMGIYYAGGNIVVERGSSMSVSTAYIICEYTKTTD